MAMENSINDLKRYILLSGIPLEFSVSKKFQEMGFLDLGEYHYERDGKSFSIDILAREALHNSDDKKIPSLYIDFLVECKYKEKNHKWFFIPFEAKAHKIEIDGKIKRAMSSTRSSSWYHNVIELPPPTPKKWEENFGWSIEDIRLGDLETCNKGVEVYKNGCNPASIQEAVSQVLFGTSHAFFEIISEKFIGEFSSRDKEIFIKIPIIVTTAELFIPKKYIDLDDFIKYKPDKFFKKVGALVLEPGIPLSLKKYSRSLREILLNQLRNSESVSEEDIKYVEEITEYFPDMRPNCIFIINYDTIEEEIEKIKKIYLEEFERYKSIQKKTLEMEKIQKRAKRPVKK